MMQDIATAKSEIAAFATGKVAESTHNSESNEMFGKVFQDQKTAQILIGKSRVITSTDPTIVETNASVDGVQNTITVTDKGGLTTLVANLPAKISSDRNFDRTLDVTNAQPPVVKSGDADATLRQITENVDGPLPDQVSNKNLDVTQQTAVQVVQQWVSLVSNLKVLADNAKTQDIQTVDAKPLVGLLKNAYLPKVANNDLLKELANRNVLENIVASNEGANIGQVENIKDVVIAGVNPDVAAKPDVTTSLDLAAKPEETTSLDVAAKPDETTSLDVTAKPDETTNLDVTASLDVTTSLDVMPNNEATKLNSYELIESIINRIRSQSDSQNSIDSPHKTVELLLEQPEIINDLIVKLQEIPPQNEANLEQQTIALSTQDSSPSVSKLVQAETLEQIDITQLENHQLLKVLMLEPQTKDSIPEKLNSIGIAETVNKIAKTATDRDEVESELRVSSEPMNLTKQINFPAPDLEQELKQQTSISAVQSNTVQLDSLQQTEQVSAVAYVSPVASSNTPQSTKTEKFPNNGITFMLSLSENKFDKVLENIAERVFETKDKDGAITPEKIVQQSVVAKNLDILSAAETPRKDFVANLKAGLDEFKQQLSLGREPGIDLKALVSDALVKTTDNSMAKVPVNLEKIVSSVSQVLDFAQSMSRAIEQHHDQVYSASIREVAQVQAEQAKQVHINQFDAKFEKGVNITKPEGHQQLAEKVRWMVNTKNLVAEIRLDPAELGSMNVKVTVSGESATVNFVVQSHQARDVIDTATPRLKEMLAEKGIELGESSVHQESQSQEEQNGSDSIRQDGRDSEEPEDVELAAQTLGQQNIVNGALGGIDYFV